MNATVDPDLVKLVHQHVNSLAKDVEALAFEVEEDREKVLKALKGISTKLDELENRIACVECEQEVTTNKVDTLQADLEATQKNLKNLEFEKEDVKRQVAQVKAQLSSTITTTNRGKSCKDMHDIIRANTLSRYLRF